MTAIDYPQKPLVDWLTYISYERQRIASPEIPYYKWRKIFTDAALFEEIFENYINTQDQGAHTNVKRTH